MDYEQFVATSGPRVRSALIAAYGPEAGGEAWAEARAYAWEHWPRLSAMANPAGYLYRVYVLPDDGRLVSQASRSSGWLAARQMLLVGSPDGAGGFTDLVWFVVAAEREPRDGAWRTLTLDGRSHGYVLTSDWRPTRIAIRHDPWWLMVLVDARDPDAPVDDAADEPGDPTRADLELWVERVLEADTATVTADGRPEVPRAEDRIEVARLANVEGPSTSTYASWPDGVSVETFVGPGPLVAGADMDTIEPIEIGATTGWLATRVDHGETWRGLVWSLGPGRHVAVSGAVDLATLLDAAGHLVEVDEATWLDAVGSLPD